ncbi:hypothetical protein HDV00_010381 [Rhizophlyctis rosea]|nr:hypothetical protein HDV00_010381 [Rhizophlyctis rosea]
MALVNVNEDVVVIAGDSCQKRAYRKLQILKQFPADKEEVQKLTKIIQIHLTTYGDRPVLLKYLANL